MPRRVNLIPMAGAGQRFHDAGYTVPKPLIEVAGVPMIVRAARSLPKPDQWIFVCRQEHLETSAIEAELKKHFDGCLVIAVDHLTEGQACTCLLARGALQPDDVLTIGACDNAMIWDESAYQSALASPRTDFLVWTFRDNPAVLQDPRMYGWVRADEAGRIASVSVKVPISDNPMRDHAVIGAFTFKRADTFLKAADAMIAANDRIKNEFYVDNAVNHALAAGFGGQTMEVRYYICWGTPRDLETYNYWNGCLAGNRA